MAARILLCSFLPTFHRHRRGRPYNTDACIEFTKKREKERKKRDEKRSFTSIFARYLSFYTVHHLSPVSFNRVVYCRKEKRKKERRSQKKAGNVRGSRVLHKHRCSVIYDATLYDFLYTRVSYMYYLFTRAQNEGKRRRTRACVGSRTRRIFSDASALFSPRGEPSRS